MRCFAMLFTEAKLWIKFESTSLNGSNNKKGVPKISEFVFLTIPIRGDFRRHQTPVYNMYSNSTKSWACCFSTLHMKLPFLFPIWILNDHFDQRPYCQSSLQSIRNGAPADRSTDLGLILCASALNYNLEWSLGRDWPLDSSPVQASCGRRCQLI